MSKYPNNPYWDHDNDRVVPIVESAVWQEAEAGGHITWEHREERLRNRLMHALDLNDGSMAYDQEGFATALIAEGIRAKDGYTLHVYPNDHLPAHFHVRKKGDPDLNLRVAIQSGEILENSTYGSLSSKKVDNIVDFAVSQKIEEIENLWAKNGVTRKSA